MWKACSNKSSGVEVLSDGVGRRSRRKLRSKPVSSSGEGTTRKLARQDRRGKPNRVVPPRKATKVRLSNLLTQRDSGVHTNRRQRNLHPVSNILQCL